MRHKKRKNFTLPRQNYFRGDIKPAGEAKKPDIINIWEEQKRLRAESVRLEKEYEHAKLHVKQLQIQIRQRNKLLSDSEALQSTLTEDIARSWQNSRLWTAKSYKQLKIKLTVFYLKTRQRLKLPVKNRNRFRREKVALFALASGAVLGLFVLLGNPAETSPVPAESNASDASSAGIRLNQTPVFNVLKPNDRDIAALGGYALVSPEDSPPAYAYVDEIGGIRIRVTQQELPPNIRKDSNELEKVAYGFNANRTIFTDKDTIYIGQSTKGPQSIILRKNNLLILISSDSKLSDDDWKAYIQSLVPAN